MLYLLYYIIIICYNYYIGTYICITTCEYRQTIYVRSLKLHTLRNAIALGETVFFFVQNIH